MNGAQLRARRTALGLTQSQLAEALEVSANTVARWERDEMAMPGMIDLALKSLEAKPTRPAAKKSAKAKKK